MLYVSYRIPHVGDKTQGDWVISDGVSPDLSVPIPSGAETDEENGICVIFDSRDGECMHACTEDEAFIDFLPILHEDIGFWSSWRDIMKHAMTI